MYIILALLGALFAAITAITGKVALQKVSPLWVASIKTFLMSLLLITISFIYFKGEIGTLKNLDSKHLFALLITAIAGSLSWIFSFYALKLGDANKVSALDKTSLVFVLILAIIFLHEKVSWINIVGILMITIGAFLVIR